jgi:hypothetical protein
MTSPINWQYNGPLPLALRLTPNLPGATANISLLAPPVPGEFQVICDLAGNEIATAMLGLGVTANGPAVAHYRSVARESRQAEAVVTELTQQFQQLRDEHATVAAAAGAGLARKLAAVERKITATTDRLKTAKEEAAAVQPVLATARANAEAELAQAAERSRSTATMLLDARRQQLVNCLLAEAGARLTALLGVDQALVQLRSNSDLAGAVKLLDSLIAQDDAGRQ